VWRDESGIGGFFEDLPVLVFVLGGVSLLIFSSVWSAGVMSSNEASDTLEKVADGIVQMFVLTPCEGIPSVDEVASACASYSGAGLESCGGVFVNVSVVHPYTMAVGVVVSGDTAHCTGPMGYAVGVMNAVDSSRLIVILEVRALVW